MMLKVFMRFGFWWMNIIFKTVNGFMIHEILPKPPRGGGYLPFYYERFFSRLDRGIGFSYWTFISPIGWGYLPFYYEGFFSHLDRGVGFSYGLSFPPFGDSFPAWIGVLAFLIDFHFPHLGYLPFY
jgi:hypothetical protein